MKVSIVIPTLNEGDLLPRLLASIGKQTFRDYEVIVADAKSGDNTKQIATSFGAKVVRGGMPGEGRNAGVRRARGEFLFFFDADVVIATGQRTGDTAPLGEARAIKRATGLPMLIGSGVAAGNETSLHPVTVARLIGVGLCAGALAGFFGIGGGFLIVPGLILAAELSTLHAIGSSLLAVGAFGLTTAINYAVSGLVEWWIALLFILGGILGGWLGAMLARHLAKGRDTLNRVFGAVVVVVALYMLAHSAGLLSR